MKHNKESLLDKSLRHVIRYADFEMKPYDRYGESIDGMEWFHISGKAEDGFECFLLRFKPGIRSKPHEHSGYEQFLVLDGELEDCDGEVFRTGDFVSFKPGSRHYSVSPNGCTLLVILRGQNYALD